MKNQKKLRPYESACVLAGELFSDGFTYHQIAKRMMRDGYATATGGHHWYYGTARSAVAKAKPATAAKPARRGHKRVTRDGWESLPEPVREAVIGRVLTALGL